jgi:uncharacterized SAM-binding protein YcdF (DUF218 family)
MPQELDKRNVRANRLSAMVRGVALFLGVFSVLNVVGEGFIPGFDANIWWIDLHPLPAWACQAAMLLAGVLAAYALAPAWFGRRRWLARATAIYLLALIAICVLNSVRFYRLVIEGEIQSSFPLPLSLVIACFLILVLSRVVRTAKTPPSGLGGATKKGATKKGPASGIAICFVLCAVIFPVAQMFCFGLTDYRRPADAIVVFGAGISPDGTPSPALYDRVRTGCLLYRQGLAPVLIFSGGNERPTDEPTVMKRLAVEMGVPAAAIVLDPGGLNTDATVNNCRRLLPAMHAARVLAVSHFYHLPRVKMTFARAGIDVCTVPAEQTHILRALPYYMAREVAALWAYYFRPIKL